LFVLFCDYSEFSSLTLWVWYSEGNAACDKHSSHISKGFLKVV